MARSSFRNALSESSAESRAVSLSVAASASSPPFAGWTFLFQCRYSGAVVRLRSDLRAFIRRRFTCIDDVDVLSLLLKHPGRTWTGADIAVELGMTAEIASARLCILAAGGMIACEAADGARYRYVTSDDVEDAMIRELAEACFIDRSTVIAAVEQRGQPLSRRLADAFRQWNR